MLSTSPFLYTSTQDYYIKLLDIAQMSSHSQLCASCAKLKYFNVTALSYMINCEDRTHVAILGVCYSISWVICVEDDIKNTMFI